MHIDKKSTYTLISSDENSLAAFQKSLIERIQEFTTVNLILQISDDINATTEEFSLFLDIAQKKQRENTSFAIISSLVTVDEFPETLNIVPTLQEAEDILEMEAIERELGF